MLQVILLDQHATETHPLHLDHTPSVGDIIVSVYKSQWL